MSIRPRTSRVRATHPSFPGLTIIHPADQPSSLIILQVIHRTMPHLPLPKVPPLAHGSQESNIKRNLSLSESDGLTFPLNISFWAKSRSLTHPAVHPCTLITHHPSLVLQSYIQPTSHAHSSPIILQVIHRTMPHLPLTHTYINIYIYMCVSVASEALFAE